jgi:site-specific DNA-adenine methylase
MPPHRVYIETHLGGGAVMLNKRAAKVSIGIDIDEKVVARWRAMSVLRCDLVQADAVCYLNENRFLGDELVYADPPYVPSTRRRARVYAHDYELEDHVRLLATLKALPCMVMLSGYDNDLYGTELSNWHKSSFPAKTHTGLREEHVWTNFEPPLRLHDGRHLGDNFRARQAIKRRRLRLEERFARMNPRERHELLQGLNARFGIVGSQT